MCLKGDTRLQRVSATAARQIASSVHGSAAALGCEEFNDDRADELEVFAYLNARSSIYIHIHARTHTDDEWVRMYMTVHGDVSLEERRRSRRRSTFVFLIMRSGRFFVLKQKVKNTNTNLNYKIQWICIPCLPLWI
jgi:hypothetical protein